MLIRVNHLCTPLSVPGEDEPMDSGRESFLRSAWQGGELTYPTQLCRKLLRFAKRWLIGLIQTAGVFYMRHHGRGCNKLAILCVFPHKWPSRYIKELKLHLSVAVCGLRLLTENGQLTIGACQIKRMAIGLSCSQHRRLGWRMTLKSWLRYWQESFSTSISLFSTWRDWWYFVLFGKQVRRCYCYGGSKWSHLEWCYFVFNFTVEAG